MFSRESILRWTLAASFVVLSWGLGVLVRRFGLRPLSRLTRRTPTDLDELLLAALRPQIPFLFLLLGVAAALRWAAPSAIPLAVVARGVLAAFTFSAALAAADFLARLLERRAERWPGGLPATTLTQSAVRVVVIGLGALVVLGSMGIAIAPVLTALGVGSLAVALALQPTLSNLFAGLHITLARRIRVGDFLELEGGQQGYVQDIGWRSTQIRELPNNVLLVPNSRLAEIIVRNFALPETEQAALVQVGVAYGSDLEQVERITIETARAVQRSVPGAQAEFEPFIRFHTFGASSIDFTVILRVREFVDRYLVTHEFIKRLHEAYARAGIEIPFPQRVVHLRPGESSSLQ